MGEASSPSMTPQNKSARLNEALRQEVVAPCPVIVAVFILGDNKKLFVDIGSNLSVLQGFTCPQALIPNGILTCPSCKCTQRLSKWGKRGGVNLRTAPLCTHSRLAASDKRPLAGWQISPESLGGSWDFTLSSAS